MKKQKTKKKPKICRKSTENVNLVQKYFSVPFKNSLRTFLLTALGAVLHPVIETAAHEAPVLGLARIETGRTGTGLVHWRHGRAAGSDVPD